MKISIESASSLMRNYAKYLSDVEHDLNAADEVL